MWNFCSDCCSFDRQSDAELAKQIANDPTNPQVRGAKASLRDDAQAQGGKALRLDVPRKGANPWDSTVGGPVGKPIKPGDNLVLVCRAARKKEAAGPTATLPYEAVQLASAPYSTVMTGPEEIGPEWKQFQLTGKADADYPAGALKVTPARDAEADGRFRPDHPARPRPVARPRNRNALAPRSFSARVIRHSRGERNVERENHHEP